MDASGCLLEANASLSVWLGIDDKELKGKELMTLLCQRYPEWEPQLEALWNAPGVFGQISLVADRFQPRQWFQCEIARHPAGAWIRIASVLPPQQELAEAAWDEHLSSDSARRGLYVRLMRAEAQLDNLVHRWPGVIFSQRADFSFQYISPRIEELSGVSVADWSRQPHRFWEVIHEADVEELKKQIKEAARTGEVVSSTFRIRNPETGRVAYVLEHRKAQLTGNGLMLGYEGVWLDITRQAIAEKRLSSAAWKETLSVLTMGLAHDFSNIMAGIHSLSESFLAQLEKDHAFYEGMGLIKVQSMQASQLIHRIVQLHHGRTGERTYSDLNEVISNLVDLARKILPRRVEVRTELAAETLPVYADAVEFCQVILNLTLNAADAMPQCGRLVFHTARVGAYPPMGHVEGVLPRLPAMCLSVKDTGHGIPVRNLSSIFDPFFTTKPLNRGSGLGLYNARLFAEKHHGAISVDSEVGKGTTFSIWLPEADFSEIERNLSGEGRRHSLLVVGVGETMLDRTVELLREQGFHVVAARNCEQALERIRSSDYRLSGLWLLVDNKTASWGTLLEELRRSTGRLKIMVQITGCNQDEISSSLLQQADLVFNPNTPMEAMFKQVRTILGAAGEEMQND